jgi:hypothetical protein
MALEAARKNLRRGASLVTLTEVELAVLVQVLVQGKEAWELVQAECHRLQGPELRAKRGSRS